MTHPQKTASLTPLFKRVIGPAFDRMPAPILALHCPADTTVFTGIAQIDRADNWRGALLARLFRFPPAGSDIPVEVTIEPRGDRERWRRRFGRSEFSTRLGHDTRARCLTEQFGLIRFQVKLECHENGLDMNIQGARLGFIPLPRFLVPWTRAFERLDAQGRFNFDVEIGLAGIGRLVRYRGWLAKTATSE